MTDHPNHPAFARTGSGVAADGTFHMPTRVQFGRGVATTLATEVKGFGASTVMVVTDPGIRSAGLVDPLVDQLESAGVKVTVFDLVQPNPRDVHCIEGADLARAGGTQLLVGIGGGSAMDTAKCMAVLLTNGGHPRDWEDFGALRNKKMNLFDPRICPRVALVDPDLTFSVPSRVTAATGMDALSHAIDSLHCRLDTPASDGMALEGARLVALYLERAVADGRDIEARCGMAQASLVAGLAVGITDVAGCHSIAEAVGAVYDHSHGVCCAVGLPMIMDYNFEVSKAKYVRLAMAFGIDVSGLSQDDIARSAVEYVRALNARLAIPTLTELIVASEVELLAAKAYANTSTPSNPRPASVSDFQAIFEHELQRDAEEVGAK
jgi:alcohol dehydrogenase